MDLGLPSFTVTLKAADEDDPQLLITCSKDGVAESPCKRTFSEFERLHAHLSATYPDSIVPALPRRVTQLQITEIRLGEFLNSVFGNERLRRSEVLGLFLDRTQFAFAPPAPVARRNQSSLFSGLMPNPQTKEIDSFFVSAAAETTYFQSQCGRWGKLDEQLSCLVQENGRLSMDFGTKLGQFMETASDRLPGSLWKIAKMLQKADDVECEFYRQHGETWLYYQRKAQAVNSVLSHRMQVLGAYEMCCKITQKKILAMEKLKSSTSIRAEKVDMALSELSEAKKIEAEARDSLKTVSQQLRQDFTAHTESWDRIMNEHIGRLAQKCLEYARYQTATVGCILDELNHGPLIA
ncbi:uncharacterized protein BJ171DRAFT_190098 [Polychytrium aggregatum]|uniref:uncharacterized protein n=1 Tax=Polychytrium aggregatum TaxID=110093 RepID=UPI0022FEC7EB|nr:uncharacterized protein BJ171DRAFT_190098 [Polychytrium aggregatum]KAI9202041.1 hypothetical protein BJ171DRAFT_190098 [Polychytrium aggregatum]